MVVVVICPPSMSPGVFRIQVRARERALMTAPEKACDTLCRCPDSPNRARWVGNRGGNAPGLPACASARCGLLDVGQRDSEELSAGLSV